METAGLSLYCCVNHPTCKACVQTPWNTAGGPLCQLPASGVKEGSEGSQGGEEAMQLWTAGMEKTDSEV